MMQARSNSNIKDYVVYVLVPNDHGLYGRADEDHISSYLTQRDTSNDG